MLRIQLAGRQVEEVSFGYGKGDVSLALSVLFEGSGSVLQVQQPDSVADLPADDSLDLLDEGRALLLDGLADLRAKYGDAKERERALARGRCVGTRPAWRKERHIGPGKMKTRPASHHKDTHTPCDPPPTPRSKKVVRGEQEQSGRGIGVHLCENCFRHCVVCVCKTVVLVDVEY